ncbi:hypothetical protein KCU78_g7397, partial [Aureobasidium melanogenum]
MFWRATAVALLIFDLPRVLTQNADGSDDRDLYDFSWITKWSAIGDSSASWACSRYDGAYPNLINLQLGTDPGSIDFMFSACSGAVTSEVIQQAKELTAGQQMITISSGGNDAGLSSIVNACVYTYKAQLSGDCTASLDKAQSTIESAGFASKLDELLSIAKSKLADNGTIYYTGYARFWDSSSADCDSVSWSMWFLESTWQYLTQARRQRMNELVDMMNAKLEAAVAKAGKQVVFVNYDSYVDMLNGRYCTPGFDENAGKSADRDYAFFYQMHTEDKPLLQPGAYPPKNEPPDHDELRKREGSAETNDTLGAVIGGWIETALKDNPDLQLRNDNANEDLIAEVEAEKQELRKRGIKARRAVRPHIRGSTSSEILRRGWNNTSNGNASTTGSELRPISSGVTLNASLASNFSINSTHQKFFLTDWIGDLIKWRFVPDSVSRVFHPTQAGHFLIANAVLWNMASVQNPGLMSPEVKTLESLEATCPVPPAPMCEGSSTNTWADRDVTVSAISEFCSKGENVNGAAGQLTSGVYEDGSLNYVNLSIAWNASSAIGDGTCKTYFMTALDSCDTDSGLKHGGSIGYMGAELSITPLVVQREWDRGRPDYHVCNDLDNNKYVKQSLLASNIQDYCSKSAANSVASSDHLFSMDYNVGTPSAVTISTKWPTGDRHFQIFEEECNYYLNTVMNGCDTADNVMNWKHGGYMSDNNDVIYTITPLAERPPPPDTIQASCTFKFSWFHHYFTVSGGGWADVDNGKELMKQLGGCGLMTSPHFHYLSPPEGVNEFWGDGSLPQTMKPGCIERAIATAGGPKIKCS